MFFSFCSNKSYAEKNWGHVWLVEVAIQANIMGDIVKLRNASPEEIKLIIKRFLMRIYPQLFSSSMTLKLINTVLDDDASHIKGFLEKFPDIDPATFDMAQMEEYGLMPTATLTKCLSESEEFRKCVTQQADFFRAIRGERGQPRK